MMSEREQELADLIEEAKDLVVSPDEQLALIKRVRTGSVSSLYKLVDSYERYILSIAEEFFIIELLSAGEMLSTGRLILTKLAVRELGGTNKEMFALFAEWAVKQAILKNMCAENRDITWRKIEPRIDEIMNGGHRKFEWLMDGYEDYLTRDRQLVLIEKIRSRYEDVICKFIDISKEDVLFFIKKCFYTKFSSIDDFLTKGKTNFLIASIKDLIDKDENVFLQFGKWAVRQAILDEMQEKNDRDVWNSKIIPETEDEEFEEKFEMFDIIANWNIWESEYDVNDG